MSSTFPNREFKIVDDVNDKGQIRTVVNPVTREREFASPGGKRMKVGQIVRTIGVPKPNDEAIIPDGMGFVFYKGSVAVAPQDVDYTPKLKPQGKGSLGSWGKKNMHGWTKHPDAQNTQTKSYGVTDNSEDIFAVIELNKVLDRYIVHVGTVDNLRKVNGPDREGSFYGMKESKAAADEAGAEQLERTAE